MSEHHIRASAVRAALRGGPKWYAHSSFVDAGRCSPRGCWLHYNKLGMEPIKVRSGVTVFMTSAMLRVVEKVRTCGGPAEVKKTWGTGYRELVAQLKSGGQP